MSTILKQAHIGGYGIGAIPVEAPPAGMGTVVLFVPLGAIMGKSPIDVQKDMSLAWSASDGSGFWFDENQNI